MLKTIAKSRSEWFDDTAGRPDGSNNGNDGKNGASGFPSATVNIEIGCITGDSDVVFETKPGNGQNAQAGSDGLTGSDGGHGEDKHDLERDCNAGWHSCTNECFPKGRTSTGGDCLPSDKGTDGGNGGSGGDGGNSGSFGSISLRANFGKPPIITQTQGSPGNGAGFGKDAVFYRRDQTSVQNLTP